MTENNNELSNLAKMPDFVVNNSCIIRNGTDKYYVSARIEWK